MSKITLQYEFDSFEEQEEFRIQTQAQAMHSLIWELDQTLRATLKYGEDKWLDDEHICKYLEDLRDTIHEAGILN